MSLSSCRRHNRFPKTVNLPTRFAVIRGHSVVHLYIRQNRNLSSRSDLTAEVWEMPGIKLMPAIHNYNVDDPIVRPVVEAARDYGLIISIHSGPNNCHPNRIGTVANWVPETPVIMDHMGFPDDLDAGIAVAKANKNVSLGTTILRFHRRWEQIRTPLFPLK